MTDINIGALSEALNDKVDLDLGNMSPTQSVINRVAGWSMPTGNYEELTLEESDHEYTAPANGWVYFAKGTTSFGQYVTIYVKDTNGNIIIQDYNTVTGTSNTATILAPVKKDQTYSIGYTADGTTLSFRFIYADGDGEGQGGGGDQPVVYGSGGGIPDYASQVNITSLLPYTTPSRGVVYAVSNFEGGSAILKVNGYDAGYSYSYLHYAQSTQYAIVDEGDVISSSNDNPFSSIIFIPFKDLDTLGNRYLGQMVESFLPIEDSSLHLLDGAVLEYSGIYKNFIDHITNLYGDGTNIPNYFCSESDWQTSVSSYGSCGRFVYDSVNKTVRLPKVSDIIQGTSDVNALGDLTEAGVPNITGSFTNGDTAYFTGSFYDGGSHSGQTLAGGESDQVANFDASRSNSIYGNSDTVQPQTIKALYYMVVATGSREEVKLNFDAKADKDLVNTGFITNCITQIPQDIKVELNDNKTITIKAGTKCYIPNGFESDGTTRKFEEYIYLNDHICQCPNAIGDFFLLPVTGTQGERHSNKNATFSGPTQPTITTLYGVWYDTTNNVIKMTNDTGATWIERQVALPIALEHCITANVESSITQVFNGFGYIGSVLFALPGVIGLLPNGRNEDGTLNNIKYTIDKVRLREFSWDISGSGQYLALYSSGEIIGSSATNRPFYQQEETPPTYTHSYWYKPSENCSYATFNSDTSWTKFPLAIIGKIIGDATGKISSLTTKTTFSVVDYNDIANDLNRIETNLFNKIQEVSEPPVNYEQGVLYVIPED